jgi:triosephosphate isomerase
MRRRLIAGNWKMNGSREALAELDGIAAAADAAPHVDVAVCPPFTLIERAAARTPALPIGAQDCHAAPKGAHTGCISAGLLVEAGAKLVIVGHSERRADQGETDAQVKAKAEAAIAAGLTAIVCVGETEAQRDAGDAEAVVAAQLRGSVPVAGGDALVVAYEPVWAIGTGRIPSMEDVGVMHGEIRAVLTEVLGAERAEAVRILYGGSMNAGNAADLLAVPDVDGGLVGGASLTAAAFVPIIEAAAG